MVGINVPIPVPVAYYSFGGWKSSLFGDIHMYGPEGIQFYTHAKVVTSRWPDPGTSRSTSDSRGRGRNAMPGDDDLFERINALSREEEALWARAGDGTGLDAPDVTRLEEIKVQLDQVYDLLHQRAGPARRRREIPPEAELRSAEVVGTTSSRT